MSIQLQAKAVKDRGDHIARLNRSICRNAADWIARADDLSALDAAARESHGETLRPVVAATSGVHFRSPSEFRHVADQRVAQQTSLVQVFDQRGITLIVQRSHDVSHAFDRRERLGTVNVPRDFIEHGEERVDRHEPHASFDQSS